MGELGVFLKEYGAAVVAIGQFAFLLLLLKLRQEFVPRKEFDETIEPLKLQTEENTKAIAAIEGVLEHLPDAKDVEQLRLAIERLSGDLRAMDATNRGIREELTRTTAATTRIESFLMTKGK